MAEELEHRVELWLDQDGIDHLERLVAFMRGTSSHFTESSIVEALLLHQVGELKARRGVLWRWRSIIDRDRAREDADARRPVLLPGDLPAARRLGLTWPFTVADVERARRRLAQTQHPDVGGRAGAMRLTNQAADRLVARLEAAGRGATC